MSIKDSLSDEEKDALDDIQICYANLDDKILKYHKNITMLLELNKFNIQEKALVAPGLSQSVLTSVFAEQRLLEKMEAAREKKKEELFGKLKKDNVPHFKTEMEINETATLKEFDKAIKTQKDLVRYLQESFKIVSNFGFAVKNSIDVIKLENS